MIKQIDHIGLAVHDLGKSIHFYQDVLGLPLAGIEEIPEQKVKVAIFTVGDVRIELLTPTTNDSPVAKFLERRGDGLHHIAYRTDNIENALFELKAQGMELVDESPKSGASGKKIAFIHPKSTFGVLTELCQVMAEK